MPTDILISSDPWENRVAILEDGKLSEIYVEREERVIGSIFKGKVQNVLPGMGASFVDIGLGRNAFLYVDDINKTPLNIGDVEITSGRSGWTINEKVSRGDDVLVQIVKEPRGLKGARISTNISLPGRYLILMPTGKYSGVSRKIESADERNRLKTIMKAIRPEGMATVVRTAAGGVSNAELIADLGVLIRIWHGILESFKNAASPSLLHKDMNLVYKAARDFITPDVQNVWIDDAQEAESVRDVMRLLGPQYVERIKPYPQGKQLFVDFKIDDEINRLMKPTVKLPSGGSIVIETTEALTVIDVNSGKFTGGKNLDDTIVKTNIEAAAEIARQVRLRDIGGIIVCDFIDMSSEGDRNKVIKTLEDGLRRDRTRSTIQSFSPLGLLEFTRKRVGKDLAGQLRGTCPTCSGLGTVMSPETVTISTFRQIANHQNGHQHVHIAATPAVAAQAEFWYEDELTKLGEQIGQPIDVRIDPAVHPERPVITYGDGLPELPPVRVGDEFDVELLPNRLPVPTSAGAVVNGRLIEVENAATAAGQLIKIRILDVDGNDIIAEPRTPLSEQAAEARKAAGASAGKRRRRGGRGRKPLTAAEQEEELRELAEEAAKGLGARPAPVIGISTTDEAVAEERVGKNEGLPTRVTAKVTANGNATTPPARIPTPPAAARASSPPPVPAAAAAAPPAGGAIFTLPGETLSGSLASRLPGETLSGDRVRNAPPSPPPSNVLPFVAPPVRPAAPDDDEAAAESEASPDGESEIMHRRRRRRRRGRGGNGAGETAASAAAPLAAPAAPVQADDEDDAEEIAPAAEPVANGLTLNADGEPRRRRRRRRRRGRGGAGAADGQTGERESAAMPDRHIFRVDSDGGAHATGETSPPEPNRSIAPWNRPKKGEVAIEPPPPVLTAPAEPELKRAAPSRRRRSTTADAPAPVREIAASAPVAALPPPAAEAVTPVKATRAKKPTATASKATAAKPTAKKATAAKATAAKATVAAAPPKRAASAKKTPVKATATAKKSTTATAKKAVAKKTSTAKKSSSAKKSAAKASTAKKTTSRKKS